MLQIRRAERCDAEAAFDIRFQAIQNQCSTVYTNAQVMAWTCVPLTDKYRSWVENDYHLACVNGLPVATGLINLQSGELEAIFVLPKFMGQGIGKKMVTHLEHLARKAGLAEIHLEATLNAESFYKRCGFTASAQAVYNSPSGLQLACVPMRKQLVGLTDLKYLECRAIR
ncbi:GNAT family N-acetyltransferase [Pseudomonas syringae]|uniref:GNAT family N-acetyltransferase n=1 Tax=Pseudomonas syringae TaxID=317 RepID=UPI001F0EAFBD|nr:GNAT family N-acetyltransferase [Pseudomonas syringae]MCH5516135.1 GNAT family N-acetyltransferase [Pseudomonas syringae pv. syringae]MCH5630836.1 GNAT family N-acetyltransferase [Pseudomonas syringae pv. syringae]